MNKNEKFHGAEFDVSAQAISDEELDAVSGGSSYQRYVICPNCGERILRFDSNHFRGLCLDDPQNP